MLTTMGVVMFFFGLFVLGFCARELFFYGPFNYASDIIVALIVSICCAFMVCYTWVFTVKDLLISLLT